MKDTSTWIEHAFDDRCRFNREFISSNEWSVVLVESGLHFDEEDAGKLAEAIGKSGHTTLTAVLLEKLRDVKDNVQVEPSKQGLLAFNKDYSHFNCVLVPRDFSFAIVCTTDDYYLVAGPVEFLRLAVGAEIDEVRARFREFAGNESWRAEDRARLLSVHERYRNF